MNYHEVCRCFAWQEDITFRRGCFDLGTCALIFIFHSDSGPFLSVRNKLEAAYTG